jgi:hypothetical protein
VVIENRKPEATLSPLNRHHGFCDSGLLKGVMEHRDIDYREKQRDFVHPYWFMASQFVLNPKPLNEKFVYVTICNQSLIGSTKRCRLQLVIDNGVYSRFVSDQKRHPESILLANSCRLVC